MPSEIYEVVAQAARYWFLFLMALIVWRSWRWFARDRKQRKKRLRLLPDAGFVGELVVQTGGTELPAGLALPVAREGVLGSVRGADICVPAKGVAKKHLWFEFDDENGLYMEPYAHNSADVDGQPLAGRRTHAWLAHGSRLTVGDAVLRLRMFAGFEHAGVKAAETVAFADESGTETTAPMAAQTPEQLAAAQAANVAATRQRLAIQAQWLAAQGFTPQQIAAIQAAGLAAPQQTAAMQAQWLAAQGFTPQQIVAMQVAGAVAPQPTPQQLAAMQAQWMAAWQSAQGVTQEQLAAVQAQAAMQAQATVQPQAATAVAPPAEGVLNTAAGAFVPPPRVTATKPILVTDEADAPDGQPDAPQPHRHHRAMPLPDAAQAGDAHAPLTDAYAESDAAVEAPWAPEPYGYADYSPTGTPATQNHTFAPRVTFYAPVMDDASDASPVDVPPLDASGDPADESWPYAAYPQSNARFVSSGYTYPEHIEPDTPYEYADEDEAPRSLYVEPDEAEKAKRLLWDKYLKGGRR